MSELKIKYQFSKKKNKKVFLFYLTEFLFLKLFTYPPHVVKFNAMLNLVTVCTRGLVPGLVQFPQHFDDWDASNIID